MASSRSAHKQDDLVALVRRIKKCRQCVERPDGAPLAHEPRPVLQVSESARVGIFGQAPGLKVHHSGRPFTDPSGERLRAWMGVDEATFYDVSKVAIVPMGFCFPGYNAKGADLPPRRECAPKWRREVMERLPNLQVVLLIGRYAHSWHLGPLNRATLTETVADWRPILQVGNIRRIVLPHPSWRNNTWLKRNPWFEDGLIPELQRHVRRALEVG